MIRAMGIAAAILFASITIVLAQASNGKDESPPQVLSRTGTMYDGNNANLQLPAEPDRYWADLWSTGSVGSAATTNSVSGPSREGQQ